MLRARCQVPPRYKLSHEFNLEAISSLWETHLVDMIGFDNIQHDPDGGVKLSLWPWVLCPRHDRQLQFPPRMEEPTFEA